MECSIHPCKKQARNTYTVCGVKFEYCDYHRRIPDKVFVNIKNGFYRASKNADVYNH